MSENPFSLVGKTILVTGASSGIGKEIAISCAKMGAKVVLNGRSEKRLYETASQMGEGHIVVAKDLTAFNAIPEMVSDLPQLNGIVHCAGINELIPAKQVTEADIDRIMAINFKAPVLLQAEILRQKKLLRKASVVFIASIGSDTPIIGNSVYSASKGAIVSYSKSLMLELAPRQIRVNCISPGMIWTNLIEGDSVTIEQLKEEEKKYPLQRYGQPSDVAGLAVYLLSDASEWMTGSNVRISGGIV